MNAKKLIAAFLALVLCAGILSACETKPVETAPPTTNSTEPAAVVLKNTDIYPLDFTGTLTCATSRTNVDETVFWLAWEEHTGVDVEWRPTAQEQTPLLFASASEMPDMFFQVSGLTIPMINGYGQSGLLINYMDYLDKMPNIAARYAEDPRLFDAVKDANGAVYTLPYICDTLTMSSHLFYIQTDMTKAAGWEELPDTIEEFLTMCEDLQTYYADVDGYIPMLCNAPAAIGYDGYYSQFFFPAFGELMQPGLTTNAARDKIEAGFATEQFKNYISFMHTLYAEGYMDPECFIADANTSRAKMIEKSATMCNTGTFLTRENFASGELDFQVMPPMSSQYQSETRWAKPNTYRQGMYMISSSCKELDAALAFMDALYSVRENPLNDEGTVWGVSIWIGELGVNYTLDEDAGSYSIIVPEGFDTAGVYNITAGSGNGAYLKWPYYEASGSGQEKKALGTRDILLPHGVDVFSVTLLNLTEDEQDIYNDNWTEINAYVTEMNAAFITGQKDISAEWDNYIATLYKIGLQEILNVYQAALERYNAGN